MHTLMNAPKERKIILTEIIMNYQDQRMDFPTRIRFTRSRSVLVLYRNRHIDAYRPLYRYRTRSFFPTVIYFQPSPRAIVARFENIIIPYIPIGGNFYSMPLEPHEEGVITDGNRTQHPENEPELLPQDHMSQNIVLNESVEKNQHLEIEEIKTNAVVPEKSQHSDVEEVDIHQLPKDSTFIMLSSPNIKDKAANTDGEKIERFLNEEVIESSTPVSHEEGVSESSNSSIDMLSSSKIKNEATDSDNEKIQGPLKEAISKNADVHPPTDVSKFVMLSPLEVIVISDDESD